MAENRFENNSQLVSQSSLAKMYSLFYTFWGSDISGLLFSIYFLLFSCYNRVTEIGQQQLSAIGWDRET